MSSMMRQATANNRFRRDDRQLDEDEELWFDNDEDFEEDSSASSVSSGSGEPVKTVVSPVPGYKQQLYSERSSPVERHRSPSAGPNGRVNWKAKYLK